MPEVELKVRRIGAANYQVPVEVTAERKQTLRLTLARLLFVSAARRPWKRS
jgi:ribosomal protein S7